jgi:hypothetical protein
VDDGASGSTLVRPALERLRDRIAEGGIDTLYVHSPDRLARKYAQRVKVPGFRPGKAPLSIIRQRFGADLRSEVTQEIISRTWKETVADRGLEPITEPVIEKVEAEPGLPLGSSFPSKWRRSSVTDYKGIPVTSLANRCRRRWNAHWSISRNACAVAPFEEEGEPATLRSI